jgi:hypothetical protein
MIAAVSLRLLHLLFLQVLRLVVLLGRPSSTKDIELNRPGVSGDSDVPRVSWSRVAGFSRGDRDVELLVLDRSEHAQGAVSAAPVMEDLEVLEQCVGQLDAGAPASAVE